MITSLFRDLTQRRKSNPGIRRVRPRLEVLEDRTAPAINLNVNQFGGLLLIEDSDLFDGATTSNAAEITYNAGRVTVTGTGGTTVNGISAISFFGIVDVVAEFGNGNDELHVAGVTLAGNVQMSGHLGEDDLLFTGTNTIGGRILFLGGDGNNDVDIQGNLTAFGALEIINGDGQQEVRIGSSAATDTAVFGSIFVRNGVNTSVTASSLLLGGNLGANVTVFGSVVYLEDGATTANSFVNLETTGSSFIGGDLFVNTAAGSDVLTVRNFTIRGNLIDIGVNRGDDLRINVNNVIFGHVIFDGGDGPNLFSQDGDLVVFGNIDIRNGDNFHTVEIGQSAGSNVTVFGGIFVNNGGPNPGNPHSFILGTALGGGAFVRVRGPVVYVDHGPRVFGTSISFLGPVTVGGNVEFITGDAGAGINLDGTVNVHGDLFALTRGSSDRFTQSATSALTVLGNTTVLTDAGADTVTVNGTFRGGVFVDAGAGADTVHFGTDDNNTIAVFTSVAGPATVVLGDGANTLRVNETSFAADVVLIGGIDSDIIEVEKLDTGFFTNFNGALLAFLGAGNDRIDAGLNTDPNDGARINGPLLLLDGGDGADDELFIGSGVPLPGIGVTPGGAATSRPGNNIGIATDIIIAFFEDFTTP